MLDIKTNKNYIISIRDGRRQEDIISNLKFQDRTEYDVTFIFDAENLSTEEEFYTHLYTTLFGEDSYGHNLDALNDVFTDSIFSTPNLKEFFHYKFPNTSTKFIWKNFRYHDIGKLKINKVLDILLTARELDYSNHIKEIDLQVFIIGEIPDLDEIRNSVQTKAKKLTEFLEIQK